MDAGTNPTPRDGVRAAAADRLRIVRRERVDSDGGATLAELLHLPVGTWLNYQRGVAIPGEILLAFILLMGVEPLWLLRGTGERYRTDRR